MVKRFEEKERRDEKMKMMM